MAGVDLSSPSDDVRDPDSEFIEGLHCPDCETYEPYRGICAADGWRTGKCDVCSGRGRDEDDEICLRCDGTGSPRCCRCEGTGFDSLSERNPKPYPPSPLLHTQGDLFDPDKIRQLTDEDRHKQRVWFVLMDEAKVARDVAELSRVVSEARRQLDNQVMVGAVERVAIDRAAALGIRVGRDAGTLIHLAEPVVVPHYESNPELKRRLMR